jgi:hypothetical protein
VILVPLAIWIYTLVFAFSSLWFAHYALAALQDLRREPLTSPSPTEAPSDTGWVTAPPHAQARFGANTHQAPDDITDVESRPSR